MNGNSVTRKRNIMTVFAICFLVLVVASFMKVSLAKEIPETGIMPVMMKEATIGTALTSDVVEMRTIGTVVIVSDRLLDIEHSLKGSEHSPEVMEFALNKPVKVETGDRVCIAYLNKDQKHIAAKVTVISKKKRRNRHIKDDRPAYAGDISGRLI